MMRNPREAPLKIKKISYATNGGENVVTTPESLNQTAELLQNKV